ASQLASKSESSSSAIRIPMAGMQLRLTAIPWNNACDPKFSITISSPDRWAISNPLSPLQGRFTIHVKVDDFDPIGAPGDYMGTFVVHYCVAGNDGSSGHDTCSPAGGKLCLPTYDPVSSCRQTYCASRTPCKNNGTCANLDSGFACECVGLWGGPTCETKLSACDSLDTPCRNNGTCIPGTGAGGCSCTPGFNGTFCESDIDECAASPPVCQHASACRNQFGHLQLPLLGWMDGKKLH
uniref:EGF-like domain-containing protein n=1 Tax=Macrostomum lignano TaxID=282301 RepID=A0A1I8FDI5_9PLAT